MATIAIFIALLAAMALASSAAPADPKTKLVSKESNGTAAMGGDSEDPAISDKGRFIAFESTADNLSGVDDNAFDNIFVHDRATDRTKVASLKSNGDAADGDSANPSISRNGRYVAFQSEADNLPGLDAFTNLYVHDRRSGKTTLVSKTTNGNAADDTSDSGSISNNGRFVAFESGADNLSAADNNGVTNIFIHDRETGRTRLVSRKSNGEAADDSSFDPLISGNGRHVVFESEADNLPGMDGFRNIYVRDLERRRTELVTKASNGDPADADSEDQVITCRGGLVAFESQADNLSGGEDESIQNVFVHNLETGKTRLVSKASNGDAATGGDSVDPDISCHGRYVVIQSDADNLSGADNDTFSNIYVHDRDTGKTRLVSRASDGGAAADDESDLPEPNAGTISTDGAFIVFRSSANNLSGAEDEGFQNVFVRGPLR